MNYFVKLIAFYLLRLIYLVFSRVVRVEKGTFLFESFRGKNMSDSPGALSTLLDSDCKIIWVCNKENFLTEKKGRKKNVHYVIYKSLHYWFYLSRSQVIVSNCILPFFFVKKSNQTYCQTWHGTAMKRLGLDITIDNKNTQDVRVVHRVFALEGSRADLFLSPSRYMDEKLKNIFNICDSKLLRAGYPKNDAILNVVSVEKKSRVMHSLGLDLTKPTLIYAPTFRDGLDNSTVERLLSDKCFVDKVGKHYNLIFRGHYYQNIFGLSGFIDVSQYPDINDLFMISDVLITDYSSVFFDYSLLERPIYFFTPDKREYEKSIRGVYFNLETDFGIKHYSNVDDLRRDILRGKFSEGFANRINSHFNHREDGNNASRVLSILKERCDEF